MFFSFVWFWCYKTKFSFKVYNFTREVVNDEADSQYWTRLVKNYKKRSLTKRRALRKAALQSQPAFSDFKAFLPHVCAVHVKVSAKKGNSPSQLLMIEALFGSRQSLAECTKLYYIQPTCFQAFISRHEKPVLFLPLFKFFTKIWNYFASKKVSLVLRLKKALSCRSKVKDKRI